MCGSSNDDFGIGQMQYYPMDSIASQDNQIFSFDVDPDQNRQWNQFLNNASNFMFYHKLGNVACMQKCQNKQNECLQGGLKNFMNQVYCLWFLGVLPKKLGTYLLYACRLVSWYTLVQLILMKLCRIWKQLVPTLQRCNQRCFSSSNTTLVLLSSRHLTIVFILISFSQVFVWYCNFQNCMCTKLEFRLYERTPYFLDSLSSIGPFWPRTQGHFPPRPLEQRRVGLHQADGCARDTWGSHADSRLLRLRQARVVAIGLSWSDFWLLFLHKCVLWNVMDMFNSKSLFERWTFDISNKFAGIALEFEETWETDPWIMVGHRDSCCGLTRDHQNHFGEAIPGAWNIWMAMSTVTWYAGGHSHDYKDLQ